MTAKYEEVKSKVVEHTINEDEIDAFEKEIENVEEKLEEMIEEISE